MPNCRGTYYTALRAFLKERFGTGAWDELLAALDPRDRVQVESAVSIAWTDIYLRMRVTAAFVRLFGVQAAREESDETRKAGFDLLVDFGHFEAEKDLTTTQRVFLRMANPAYVLEKAGQYWSRFYDWGDLKVDRKAKTHAVAKLLDSAVVDELFCIHLVAYIERMFQLVGAKVVRVEHTECLARGDLACIFDVKWQ